MIKDGRPYTIEDDRSADIALLSSHSIDTVRRVGRWIKDNVRTSDVMYDHTSYSLKHILQQDTGIYLTNNEFKDAMLLAGYSPIDPNELNWRYFVALTRDSNNNPNPFFKWASEIETSNPDQDEFIRDMTHDPNFPAFAEYYIIFNYLNSQYAAPEIIEIFRELWKRYTEEVAQPKEVACDV